MWSSSFQLYWACPLPELSHLFVQSHSKDVKALVWDMRMKYRCVEWDQGIDDCPMRWWCLGTLCSLFLHRFNSFYLSTFIDFWQYCLVLLYLLLDYLWIMNHLTFLNLIFKIYGMAVWLAVDSSLRCFIRTIVQQSFMSICNFWLKFSCSCFNCLYPLFTVDSMSHFCSYLLN